MKSLQLKITVLKTPGFIFLVTLFILFCKTTSAQSNVKVEFSEQYEEPKGSVVFDVVGYDDGGFVFGRYNRKGLTHINISLEKYSKSLKFLTIRDYESELNGLDVDYSSPFYFQDQLYLIGTTYDKKTKKRNLYYNEVDKSTMSLKNKEVLIQSIQENDNGSLALANYAFSRDQKVLAFYNLPGYLKKTAVLAGFSIPLSKSSTETKGSVAVYGGDMEKMWDLNFTFPYSEKLYSVKDATIGNNGDFYILGKLFEEKGKSKTAGAPNYQYVINAFSGKGTNKKEYKISLDKYYITDCSFTISNDNKIICAGFYSEKGYGNIMGSFYLSIDPETEKILTKGVSPFDVEFLKLFMSDSRAEKGKELPNFDLDQIVIREDGGAVLIGEEYYVTVSTTTSSNGSTTTRTTYHYNDIIVININPDNSVEWATKIPKRQAGSSGFYLSYAAHIKDDKIYLIFNDNEKNLDEIKPDKIYPYDGKDSYATLVTINENGTWKKSALFSNKETGVILRPIVSEQINDDELIMYAEKGRKYVIGKITFE